MVIGDLVVRIGSDTSGLEGGADKAKSAMKGMTVSTVALGTALGSMAEKAVSAAASFVKDLVFGTIETVKAQVRLAYQLQGTVASVQALALASRAAGLGQDELAVAVGRINQRLAEAARTGSGPTSDALKRLGLNAKELLNIPVDERLYKIAQRMQQLGYSVAQQADVLRQFGVRGQELVLVLENGGERIKKAQQTIQDLGIALSDVDAQTIRDATSDFKTFHNIVVGFGNQLTLKIAPIIKAVIEYFASWSKEGLGLKGVVDSIFERFLIELAGVHKLFYDVTTDVDDFLAAFVDGVNVGIEAWNKFVRDPSILWKAMLDGLKAAWDSFVDLLGAGWERFKNFITGKGIKDNLETEFRGISEIALPELGKIEHGFGKLRETMTPPKNAEEWRAYFDGIAEGTRKQSEAIVENRKKAFGSGAEVDNLSTEERKALEARLLQLKKSIATEDEMLRFQRDEELLKLKEFERKRFIEKDAAAQLRNQIEFRYMKDRNELIWSKLEEGVAKEDEILAHNYDKKLRDLADFERNSTITQNQAAALRAKMVLKYQIDSAQIQAKQYSTLAGVVDTSMSQISQIIGKEGGAAFNIMKGISMATALVKGYEAVVSAFAAGNAVGGPPVGFAFAAIAAAGVAAQIAALAAAKPQSSGGASGPAPSAGGGGGGDGGGAAAQAATPAQTLIVRGLDRQALFSGDSVRMIAEELLQYQRDGGKVVWGN